MIVLGWLDMRCEGLIGEGSLGIDRDRCMNYSWEI